MFDGSKTKEGASVGVKVDMDDENKEECDVNEQYVNCSNAFNTSQVIIFIIIIKLIK